MNHLVYLLFLAMAIMTTTTARPIPAPENAYIKSEIEKALPTFVGTGAGMGAVVAIPTGVENPLLLWPAMAAGVAAGGAVGAVGATGYGILAGTVKRGMQEKRRKEEGGRILDVVVGRHFQLPPFPLPSSFKAMSAG